MMLGMAASPGGRYYHETSRTGYDNLTRQRATFRSSDAFKGQVSRNTAFFGRQASFYGVSLCPGWQGVEHVTSAVSEFPTVKWGIQDQRYSRAVRIRG